MGKHPLPLATDAKHRCGNCRKTWKAAELEEIQDLDKRVDAGSIVPSGECLECGALCYPIEIESLEASNACREIMKYVDRNGLPVNEDEIRVILPSDLLRRIRRLIEPCSGN